MRKLSWRFTAGILTALTALGTVAYAQKQATIFVTVVAPGTGPLGNLTAKDFKAEGGKAEIKDAVRADEPLAIELIVDVSRPPIGVNPPIEEMRSALQTFVKAVRTGEPSARIGLIQAGNAAVPVVDLGAPAAALDKATGTVAPGPDTGGAVMIEGVQDASRKLATEPAPRRAIVSIDFGSPDSYPDTRVDSLAKEVYKTGVSLWAVAARAPMENTQTNGSSTMQYATRDNAFNAIIKTNGGLRVTIVTATGLKDQMQIVANSLLSQYELTIAGVDAAHVRDLKLSTSSGAKVVPSVFAR
jgi:hypothetical protein